MSNGNIKKEHLVLVALQLFNLIEDGRGWGLAKWPPCNFYKVRN